MKKGKKRIEISIQEYVYDYVRKESGRRSLSEKDYLEVVIDMDRIQNSTGEEDEMSVPEHLPAGLRHESDRRERKSTVSVFPL